MNSYQNQDKQDFSSNNDKDHQKIQTKNQYQQTIGSTLTFKIKDSLYMGTSIDAFRDQQFVLLNWIENVLIVQTNQYQFDNTLKQLYGQENDPYDNQDNKNQQQYIRYLHFNPTILNDPFFSHDNFSTISNKNQSQNKQFARNFQQIFTFIESAQQNGTSSLILSPSPFPNLETTGYVFTLCTAYMMKKYYWSLYKSLEYMNAKHPNASISEESLQFLNKLQIQLMKSTNLTYTWQQWKNNDELIIRNTFINGKQSNWNQNLKKDKNHPYCQNIYQSKAHINKSKKQSTKQLISDEKIYLNQSQPKSILKNFNTQTKQIVKSDKNKIKVIINISNNTVKQFFTNSQNNPNYETENQSLSSQTLVLKRNNFQQHKNYKRQGFKTAINHRISLSVRQIVANFKDQKNNYSKNQNILNTKKISFDNCFLINNKSLNKKKSFYNFQSCQKTQLIKSVGNSDTDGISRIFNKLKTQTDQDKTQQMQNRKLQTLPDQNSSQAQKQINSKYKQKNNTNPSSQKQSPIKSIQNKSWLQIINKKQTSNDVSLKKPINKQSTSKNKNNQQNLSNKQIIEKQSQTKVYIKQINKNMNDGLSERKMSINQRIFTQQSGRKKDKNLIIQFEDFKQMLKIKQKSIGNLISQNSQSSTKRQGLFQKDEKIASVIQKLKRQSLQNQPFPSSLRINTNSAKKEKRNVNPKQSQIKWR